MSEDYEDIKTDASVQLTRLYMKLADRRTDIESLQYVIKAYEASTQGKKFHQREIKIILLFLSW